MKNETANTKQTRHENEYPQAAERGHRIGGLRSAMLMAATLAIALLVPGAAGLSDVGVGIGGVTAPSIIETTGEDPMAGPVAASEEGCDPQRWVYLTTSPPFVNVRWECLPP